MTIHQLKKISMLSNRFFQIRADCFPRLNPALISVQQNQIAGRLGEVVTKLRASRAADEATKAVAAAEKSPTHCFGPLGVMKLMRCCQV